jgi:colicin import membrane protein
MESQANHIGDGYQRSDGRVGTLPFGEAPEPITAMLARALMYSQDAERELEHARALKMEAERYRSKVQHDTVEKTEAFCNGLRNKAERELDRAQQALEEAQEKEQAAQAVLKEAQATLADAESQAARTTTDAEAQATKVTAEADEYARSTRAQAEADAKALIERTRAELQEEVKQQHQRVDEEVRRALNGIEKMHAAVQEELAAQKLFTEALRLRAFAPHQEEIEAHSMSETHSETENKAEPARPRQARQRAAS